MKLTASSVSPLAHAVEVIAGSRSVPCGPVKERMSEAAEKLEVSIASLKKMMALETLPPCVAPGSGDWETTRGAPPEMVKSALSAKLVPLEASVRVIRIM